MKLIKATNVGSHTMDDGSVWFKFELDVKPKQDKKVIGWSDSPTYPFSGQILCELQDKGTYYKATNVRTNEEEMLYCKMTALGNASKLCGISADKFEYAEFFLNWILSNEDRQVAQASVKYVATQCEDRKEMGKDQILTELNNNYQWLKAEITEKA